MREVWVICDAQSGMFSDEYAVKVTTDKGASVTFFAPKDLIKHSFDSGEKGSFMIKAFELGKNQVKFPVETFEYGTSAVSLPSQSILSIG